MKKMIVPITFLTFCMAGANAALVAYYDYNGNANDSSGNGATGALTGGAVISADGTGYSGAAGDSSLDLGVNAGGSSEHSASTVDFSSAIANNSMSVSFWQYNVGNGGGGNINNTPFAVLGTGGEARGFGAHTTWSNGILYFDHSGCCGGAQRLTSNGALDPNLIDEWHHIVLQVDNGSKEIWLDGALLNSQATGAADISSTLTGELFVGQQFDGSVGFAGRIDEFAVYSGKLTEAEIGRLAAGTATPSDLATLPEDTDEDGLPDSWEVAFGLSSTDDGSVDPNNGPDGDPDMDGLTNLEEFSAGLEPDNDDFDMDSLLDGVETNTDTYVDATDTGTDPRNADTDGDGLSDGVEDPTESFVDASQPGTDPTKADTDGDGFGDLLEIDNGSDPTDIESTLGTPGTGELTLLAYYNYNGNANDSSGNGATGALTGGAVISADGTGYSGAAGDSSLDLGVNAGGSSEHSASTVDFSSAIANNSMSVSFWQYNVGNGGGGNINNTPFAVLGTGGEARGFGAHTTWSNGILYFDHSGCCGGAQRLTSNGALDPNLIDEWHHIVLQVDNGSKEIWLDGALLNSQETGAAAISSTLTGELFVGQQFDGTVGFAGRIDEFAVWDSNLNPSQIAALAGGASTLSVAAIPEPSSSLLILLSGLVIIRRRR